ncbi:MAG: hypothetical protein V4734_07920 [Terriglobus sp.]
MMFGMKLSRSRRKKLEDLEARIQESLALIPAAVEAAMPKSKTHKLAVTAAWVAGGVGVLTLGLLAGRELRGRYKFARRTPYDYYAHSGDQTPDLEFGVGV